MKNFDYCAPTRMIFGKDTHLKVGEIIKEYGYKKVLILYGGGSVKRTGLFDAITNALDAAQVKYMEIGGVQPNPTYEFAMDCVKKCRYRGVELILAVGGGSVIDCAKLVAAALKNPDEDPWNFLLRKSAPKAALPIGVVLTIAATGSEMSQSCVITREEGGLKRSYNSKFNRALFSILNPELTYTVSRYQTGCGIVDILSHTIERYITGYGDVDLTDRIAESLCKAVIQAGAVAIDHPDDYEARATLLWAGSLSHNDLTGLGREYLTISHKLEHEISGMYSRVAHGAGLAVIMPAWFKFAYKQNVMRFAQFAVRVWNCEMNFDAPEKTALEGIARMENYFKSLGMPTTLGELDIPEDKIDELSANCTENGAKKLSCYGDLTTEDVAAIYRLAL